jgi:hypothetical protein
MKSRTIFLVGHRNSLADSVALLVGAQEDRRDGESCKCVVL